LYLGLSVC